MTRRKIPIGKTIAKKVADGDYLVAFYASQFNDQNQRASPQEDEGLVYASSALSQYQGSKKDGYEVKDLLYKSGKNKRRNMFRLVTLNKYYWNGVVIAPTAELVESVTEKLRKSLRAHFEEDDAALYKKATDRLSNDLEKKPKVIKVEDYNDIYEKSAAGRKDKKAANAEASMYPLGPEGGSLADIFLTWVQERAKPTGKKAKTEKKKGEGRYMKVLANFVSDKGTLDLTELEYTDGTYTGAKHVSDTKESEAYLEVYVGSGKQRMLRVSKTAFAYRLVAPEGTYMMSTRKSKKEKKNERLIRTLKGRTTEDQIRKWTENATGLIEKIPDEKVSTDSLSALAALSKSVEKYFRKQSRLEKAEKLIRKHKSDRSSSER